MKTNIKFFSAIVVMASLVCIEANAQQPQQTPPQRVPQGTTQRPQQQRDPNQMTHQMSEYYTPKPAVVTPGTLTSAGYTTAPSDAIVLFDGKDLSKWEAARGGGEANWDIHDGVMTVNKQSGDIRTKQNFTDYQLHVEWCVPTNIQGEDQGRGNGGVYMQGKYEIQILDSYNSETYVNGQAASIYKQHPPLVNAMKKPGEWNVYDIIYKAPTFTKDGKYRTYPTVTVIHNGVLVQNNSVITGTTEYVGFPKVAEHGAGPILLQSHGDPSAPLSFRNIWIREL